MLQAPLLTHHSCSPLLTHHACSPPILQDHMRHGLACKVQLELQHPIGQRFSLPPSRRPQPFPATFQQLPHALVIKQGSAWGMDHLRHLFRDKIQLILQARSTFTNYCTYCNRVIVCDWLLQSVCSAARPKAILVSMPTPFLLAPIHLAPKGMEWAC